MYKFVPSVVLTLALASPAIAAPPSDVEALSNVAKAAEAALDQRSPRRDDIVTALVDIVFARVAVIVADNGLPVASGLTGVEFQSRVRTDVDALVRGALSSPEPVRRKAIYDVVAKVVTANYAHGMVDEWLRLPKLGSSAERLRTSVAKVEGARDAAAREALLAARRDREPTHQEREADAVQAALTEARGDKAVRTARMEERFRRQISASTEQGALRVDTASAVMLSDVGGPGTQNGVADAGEWVTFSLPVKNLGSQAWYSASVWTRVGHECAWVEPSQEIELPELASGSDASVSVRIYLSEACPDRTRVPILLDIRDSVRAPERPLTMEAVLNVTHVGRGVPRDARFDRDAPGSSALSSSKRLEPGLKAEFTQGLELSKPGAQRAFQTWMPDSVLTSVASSYTFRDSVAMETMSSTTNSSFAPSDDVDVATGSSEAFEAAVDAEARKRGWERPDEARSVLVSEYIVDYPGPEAAWAPPRTVELPKQEVKVVENPPTPSASAALALMKPLIRIEARETTPAKLAVAAVTTTAFDATIDEVAFGLAWCRLTQPRPAGAPDPCDPDAKAMEKAAPPAVVSLPAFVEPASYSFRTYTWLPVAWEPRVEVAAPIAPPPPPVAPPPLPKPVVALRMLPYHVGVHATFGTSALRDDVAEDVVFRTNSFSENLLGFDVAVGKTWRAGFAGALALGTDNVLQSGQDFAIAEAGGSVAHAARSPLGRFEFVTGLGASVRLAAVSGVFASAEGNSGVYATSLEASETVHYYLDEGFSMWVAPSYRQELFSIERFPVTVRVVDGSGWKFGLGGAVHF